ncbi:unnamed protein product [Rotaria socialis]|uniref:Histone-lysine N-methyltransferase SETDB2 n=1 Tax=Rotaria socialis TaxID=392032 RepID=A0A818KMA4_9BILA|nr:unnamed protein product [Rotaria socialis]CAF3518290.1 unnamed protein product [Rotaria socialis]CAF3556584.1 unnamed protein product [Rotaria socialis]CAF3744423.1 unnamed protein product [Rotaria socialis]CAF4202010.1 unnamed protein product [Rotaria socialis]
MPLAIDVGQRVLVYNPSHGWTVAYFVRAQQTNDNKLQILTCRLSNCHHKPTSQDHYRYPPERVALNDSIGENVNVGTRVLCMPSGDADTSRYIDKPLRGIIAEQPSNNNNQRYLIFADSDAPFYLRSTAIRLLLEPLSNYLSKVDSGTKQYIENYVLTYPKRRLVNVAVKDHINIELNGQWVDAIVSKVDASLMRVFLPVINKHEWLYRGSLRLQPLFNSPSTYEPPCKRFASDKQPTTNDSKCCHFLLIPLNHGWKRQIRNDLGTIVYASPCGQMFTDGERLHAYLYQTNSSLSIRQFTFDMNCRVTQKFLSSTTVYVNLDDYALGKDKVPLMLINEIDSSLPKPFEYTTERIPLTSDIVIDQTNTHGCTCTDGCLDTTKCACWQKIYDGIIQSHYYEDLIGSLKELFGQSTDEDDDRHNNLDEMRFFLYDALSKRNLGYRHGRLLEKIHSGIYECNGKCKCDSRCTNRCVQFGLNTLLQIYHTSEKGWGVRTLYDLPAGTFLSFYSGEILNDADANRRGLEKTMGDVYFTALDFLTSLKPIPLQRKLKAITQKDQSNDETNFYHDNQQQLFSDQISEIQRNENNHTSIEDKTTLSDSNKALLDHQLANYDSGIYVMDAHYKGNVSRFYNHSCSPNVFVQNVFIETWDVRFPWVAFFTATNVKAGTELVWDYSYEVDTVENRVLHCRCGSDECRHRLL